MINEELNKQYNVYDEAIVFKSVFGIDVDSDVYKVATSLREMVNKQVEEYSKILFLEKWLELSEQEKEEIITKVIFELPSELHKYFSKSIEESLGIVLDAVKFITYYIHTNPLILNKTETNCMHSLCLEVIKYKQNPNYYEEKPEFERSYLSY